MPKKKRLKGGESPQHKAVARRIAKKVGAEYKPDEGADVVTPSAAYEVEPPGGVKEGMRQLQGYRKKVYIVGTNEEAVEEAIEQTRGTTIGVVDNQGKVRKPTTRKKR